jgi:hypothetical protein
MVIQEITSKTTIQQIIIEKWQLKRVLLKNGYSKNDYLRGTIRRNGNSKNDYFSKMTIQKWKFKKWPFKNDYA